VPHIIGDSIDRLITIEMRPLGVPRGVIPALYQRVRDAVGEPLTLRAARRLHTLPTGSRVFIATGAGAPGVLPKGETDGPLGAAALARILARGLALRPILLTTAGYEEPLAAALEAYGAPSEILTLVADLDAEGATAIAAEWLDRYQRVAAIATELKGAAADGRCYFMTARECTVDARLDRLFHLAALRGLLTIGVGDGGNEVGFGNHGAAVRAVHPHGATIASTVSTDELVVAAISNWGCYGLEATLAYLLERPDLLHDAEMGARAMEACAAAGAGDGIYTRPIPYEDGQPGSVHAALITLLRQIIANGLASVEHALDLARRTPA
jgi:hypothetical protein